MRRSTAEAGTGLPRRPRASACRCCRRWRRRRAPPARTKAAAAWAGEPAVPGRRAGRLTRAGGKTGQTYRALSRTLENRSVSFKPCFVSALVKVTSTSSPALTSILEGSKANLRATTWIFLGSGGAARAKPLLAKQRRRSGTRLFIRDLRGDFAIAPAARSPRRVEKKGTDLFFATSTPGK